jgi:hypothetical protein
MENPEKTPDAPITEAQQAKQKSQQNEGLYNLIFNIVLPVLILNQLGKRLGPNGHLYALLLGLSFPIGLGLYDLLKRKKTNWISILGIVNIIFTGGFALFELSSGWFVVKETAFPLLIGIAVLISAYTKKPLIEMLIYNDLIINKDLIESKLAETQAQAEFHLHLKKSTLLFSISFLISAILNYVLAIRIFTEIPPEATEMIKSSLRNEQIARMTWLGFIVIALPSLVFTIGILMHLIHGIKKHTGLKLEEILRTQ